MIAYSILTTAELFFVE